PDDAAIDEVGHGGRDLAVEPATGELHHNPVDGREQIHTVCHATTSIASADERGRSWASAQPLLRPPPLRLTETVVRLGRGRIPREGGVRVRTDCEGWSVVGSAMCIGEFL